LFSVSEDNIDSILDVLKYNTTSYPELEDNWKSTVNYRLNDIKKSTSTEEIFKNWKQYLIPYGHKLVSILSLDKKCIELLITLKKVLVVNNQTYCS